MSESARPVPKHTRQKLRTWQQVYGAVNVVLGGASVVCTILIGANTASSEPIFSKALSVGLSLGAALAAFLVTILNARQYNLAFERAARELEMAIALFSTDPTLSPRTLGDAEVRGIKLLNHAIPPLSGDDDA